MAAIDALESRMATSELLTLREFESRAQALVDPVLWDYFAGGAGDEVTMRANEAAFDRLALLPRILRGTSRFDAGLTLFGKRTDTPIVISPTAFHKLAHSEGERATARAAAATGTILIASMAATVSIEDMAAEARKVAADPTIWFQLYLQPDLDFSEDLVRAAEDAGCRAIVVTVDSPVLGRRERDDRNKFHDLPGGLRCENLRDRANGHVRQIAMSPAISWEHIDWLRGSTALPVILKGVLSATDAELALHHGVDGLLVSNHGGRQLDTVPATIDQLPEIVAAVRGRIPLLLDGGVRRGTDVVKALALGAVAVGIGRPVVWGLAADGEKGVSRVLELLRSEFEHALTLCGCASVAELGVDFIRPAVRHA